jgi:hypothetical protein
MSNIKYVLRVLCHLFRYYEQAYSTGHDYFMLPPSGDLYSYPAEMPVEVLENYVENTENDAVLMSTSATVEWEWIAHWKTALDKYFPLYSPRNIIQGLFTVNVPYNLPIPTVFTPGEYYRVVNDNVVVFKPREWRGTEFPSNVPLSRHNFLTTQQMATELNHLPLGSCSWIYITSDGGGHLDNIYELVSLLDEHVEVVDHQNLIDLALQRYKQELAKE